MGWATWVAVASAVGAVLWILRRAGSRGATKEAGATEAGAPRSAPSTRVRGPGYQLEVPGEWTVVHHQGHVELRREETLEQITISVVAPPPSAREGVPALTLFALQLAATRQQSMKALSGGTMLFGELDS